MDHPAGSFEILRIFWQLISRISASSDLGFWSHSRIHLVYSGGRIFVNIWGVMAVGHYFEFQCTSNLRNILYLGTRSGYCASRLLHCIKIITLHFKWQIEKYCHCICGHIETWASRACTGNIHLTSACLHHHRLMSLSAFLGRSTPAQEINSRTEGVG